MKRTKLYLSVLFVSLFVFFISIQTSHAQFTVSKLHETQDKIPWKKETGQGVMRTYLHSIEIDGTGSGLINKLTYNYNGTSLEDLDSLWLCELDKWSNPKEYLGSSVPTDTIIEFNFTGRTIDAIQYYGLFAFISPGATIENIVDIEILSATIDNAVQDTFSTSNDKHLTVKENLAPEITIDATDLRGTLGSLETYGPPEGGLTITVNDGTELANGIEIDAMFLENRPIVIQRSNTGSLPPIIKKDITYSGIFSIRGANNITWDGIDFQATSDNTKYCINIDDWTNKVFCKNIVIKNSNFSLPSASQSFNSNDMRGSVIIIENKDASSTNNHEDILIENNTMADGFCGVYSRGSSSSSIPGIVIRNNAITNMQHYGVYIGANSNATNLLIENNEIGDFLADHANNDGEVQGIGINSNQAIKDTAIIRNNKIFNISNANIDCYRVRGISVEDADGGVLIANNMVYNIAAPNSNKQDGDNTARPATVAGISTIGSDNNSRFYIYYNSVAIDYSSSQDNNRCTAFEAQKINATVPVFLANNVFVNNSDLSGTTNNYCYATFTSNSEGDFSALSNLSDHNFYACANGFIAGESKDQGDGVDDTQYLTLADYQAVAGSNDANALTEDISTTVPFKDISNGDLTINNATTSAIVGGGTPLSTVTTDYEGEERNLTAPYMGADEYNNNTTLSLSGTEVMENGETSITITATASDTVAGDQSITLSVSGTNITTGDYTLSAPDLVISDGQISGSVTFAAKDDALIEITETAILSENGISSGLTLLNDSLEITIINDDYPAVDLSVSATTGAEPDQTVITVTATAEQIVDGDQTMDLSVSGTDITTGDYNLSSAIITIPDGQTTGTVDLTIADDQLVEKTETATISISGFSAGIIAGSTLSQDISITSDDNPAVNLSLSANSGSEADGTVITVTATTSDPVIGNQSVDISISGNGISASDYSLSATTVSITDGNNTNSETITISDDSEIEGTELLNISLSNPSAGLDLGSNISEDISITDDEVAYMSLSADATSANESDGETAITLTVSGNRTVIGAQSFDLLVSGTNINSDDYSLDMTTISFANGEDTQTATLTIKNDTILEEDESLIVALTNPTAGVDTINATLIIDITSDDTPFVELSVSANQGSEADETSITITASLDVEAIGSQQVELSVAGAKQASYTIGTTTLNFGSGQLTASTTFTVVDDDLIEIDDEIATISLVNPSSGLTLGQVTSQEITIIDNEEPLPVITLTAETDSTYEADEDVITITATTDKAVTGIQSVYLAIGGTATALTDAIFTSNTINIGDQATSGTTTIVIINDSETEGNETLEITVSSASAGLDWSNPGEASILIGDDDALSNNEVKEKRVTIYPNPVVNELQISNLSGITNFKIYNVLGNPLTELPVHQENNMTIDLSGIPAGLYIIDFEHENGNITKSTIIKN